MRSVIISITVFVLMLGVAVLAYQNPTTFIDSVDVTQMNVGMQKLTEWISQNDADVDSNEADIDTNATSISANSADIDTNAADIDTNAAEIDTNAAQIDTNSALIDTNVANIDTNAAQIDTALAEADTLLTDVDVLQTARDSVFSGYNTSNIEIGTIGSRRIAFNTETTKDGIYTHAANDSVVDCATAGRYEVHYHVSVEHSSGTGVTGYYMELWKYTDSWAVVPGSIVYGFVDHDATYSWGNMSQSCVVTMAAGNDLSVLVYNSAGSETIRIIANSGKIVIRKLH